jgi:hydrogenase/urease accessory protein HupE
MKRRLPVLVFLLSITALSNAHEVRPALLKVSEVSEGRYLVHWKVPATGDGRLAIAPVFDAGCQAGDDRVDGFASGASVCSWTITCRGGIADTEIGFSNLPSTMIDVLVQVTFLDGRYYTDMVRPSAPVFHVPARDGRASVFGSYLMLGIEHIWSGWDHLLFVLGLVLLVAENRRLFWAVTGFTVAHSITLALATLDVIRVPGPPVEAVIALSIVLLAVEAHRYRQTGAETLALRSPWLVSMVIGLVHGLGFAGALREFGLPAHARSVSLLAFNLGVETGQVLFIAMLIVLGGAARRIEMPVLPQIRLATVWFIGICGSFWLTERVAGFF